MILNGTQHLKCLCDSSASYLSVGDENGFHRWTFWPQNILYVACRQLFVWSDTVGYLCKDVKNSDENWLRCCLSWHKTNVLQSERQVAMTAGVHPARPTWAQSSAPVRMRSPLILFKRHALISVCRLLCAWKLLQIKILQNKSRPRTWGERCPHGSLVQFSVNMEEMWP